MCASCRCAAADDLTQETYLRVIGALKGFRGDAAVRTWLLTIARRVCAAEVSARLRDRQLAARLAAMPPAGPAGQAPEAGGQTAVALLLAGLEPGRRAAFVLTQMIGCSYAETAAICGCPVGTIRSRVARAREDLAAMMTDPEELTAGDGPAQETRRSPAAEPRALIPCTALHCTSRSRCRPLRAACPACFGTRYIRYR